MKLSKLLPIVFLAGIGLAACNQGPSEPVDTNVYTVSISNKAEIEAEWHVGDTYRTLTVAATKNGEAVNAAQLLNREIFVTSSNTSVLSAQGFVLTALSAGTTTVTVKYHGVEDTLNLTIERKLTCIDKYGTVHAGTEEDPLDNADALKVGKYVKDNSKTSTDEDDIYIKGVVDEWYHFPGERSDKYTSWYIQKAEADESRFEMYKVLKSDESALSDEEVWPGAEVLVYGPIGFYGSTFETTAATFVRITGGAQRVAPELKQTTVNAKNTGALAVGKALNDGNTTWDRYEITGYTVNFLGTQGNNASKTYNYMIADSKTETDAAKQFEIYACKQELKFNAKVKVTSRIKNYHNTIETNVLESVEVLEEGTDWVEYPEPAAIENKTLVDLFADESGNYKQAYVVTGIVSKWDSKNGTPNENGTDYGNFYLKVDAEATEEYYIYGATATASALEWSKYANKYGFVNPKDFLTNSVTKDIEIGTEITMKLVRCDYKKTVDGVETVTPEACGIVTKVNKGGEEKQYAELEKFTFHSDLKSYQAYDATKFEEFLKAATDKTEETTKYVSHEVPSTTGTNPLIGANGGSGDAAWSYYNMLKLGAASKNAILKLTFADNVKIGKIVIKADGWAGKACALKVNDSPAVSVASKTHAEIKAAIDAGTAFQTEYEITFTESNVLELTSTYCVMISEITFYSVVEAAA